jgi:glyoxylase-like metal-dependent hydrolase (beta-lactamase superfamily II)
MGDLFVSAGLPFVDRSSGGTNAGIIAAADKVLSLANAETKIIPGHGRLADKARLQQWRDALAALHDRMRREVAAGKTIEDVLAMKITEPYAKDFPGGHERFVRTLYQELAGR